MPSPLLWCVQVWATSGTKSGLVVVCGGLSHSVAPVALHRRGRYGGL